MREKSRVRIEHPDLPDTLKTAAGELTATLWSAAQAAATESFAELKSEAQASVAEAKATVKTAQSQLAMINTELEQSRYLHEEAKTVIAELQQELAAERATLEEVRTQLGKAETEIANHQQAQESARRYFTEELEKLKTAAQLDKERYGAAERRFLQETDRERQVASRLQKEVEQLRQEANRLQEQHRAENSNYQAQIGDFRHQLGVLEGRLQSVTAERDQIFRDAQAGQTLNNQLLARESLLQGELEMWRTKAEEAEKALHKVKPEPSTTRAKSGSSRRK